MKSFALGVLFSLTVSIVSNVVWTQYESGTTAHKIAWIIQDQVLQGNYMVNPLTNRCNTKRSKNGVTLADYFGCDKLQRFLNKEK